MRLYNYLFFHGYCLAMKSRSNRDMPFFIPLMLILMCFIMHLFTLSMLISGITQGDVIFKPEHRYYWVILFMVIIMLSYSYNVRYKFMLDKYKTSTKPKTWVSIMVVLIYYAGSSFLMFLSALYKNKDWFFAV
jgi:hypothetical protein